MQNHKAVSGSGNWDFYVSQTTNDNSMERDEFHMERVEFEKGLISIIEYCYLLAASI
jgi:hypothetical protein